MQSNKYDENQIKAILIGMIVDRLVLGRIASKWDGKMFRDDWANTVGEWCVDYHKRYGSAPGKVIESKFYKWAEENKNTVSINLMEKFLSKISRQYERLKKTSNSEYVLDMASDHFNKVRLERLVTSIEDGIDKGKVEKAYKAAVSFGKIEMGAQNVVQLFKEKEAMTKSFAGRREPLIQYPGALGNFFGSCFERDAFVALMGPEKRGKTFWLLDIAWRAMLQGRRVAFFEVGDMSQDQILRRFAVRASRQPLKPCTVLIPKSIDHPDSENDVPDIVFEQKKYTKPLNAKAAWHSLRVVQNRNDLQPDALRLWSFPNSTLSIAGLQAELQTVATIEEWIPDVIVLDYADILAPLPGYTESRDQINANWKAMRALSQRFHCCIVTATQSDAASYYVGTIDKSNFSDDKRKFAHVTAMFGINQKQEEKEKGVMRLNWLVFRESEFNEKRCVHVAGCLALANPAMHSTF